MGETAAAEIRIGLLGGFSVTIAGHPVPDRWRLRKAKTLVKLLALAPGHRLHRETLIDSLWEGGPQGTPNNLHQLVHTIRRMLGAESITVIDDVVRLGPADRLTVDVDSFERAAAAARGEGDITELQAVVDQWTGPLLPEDQYAAWAEEHRDRLNKTHAAVVTLFGAKLFELGRVEAALALLEPIASDRPLDERLHRLLIEVLAGLGRRWEAIEAYERLRDALEEAYAAHPQPRTMAVYHRVLRSKLPVVPASDPQQGPTPGPHTLVGRRSEWEQLSASWERASAGDSHLLLIRGDAGIGKTHLAEELLTWAEQQGVSTARTRAYGGEGRLAFAPVTGWLRSGDIQRSWDRLADVWLTETARLLPELLTERPHLPRPEPITEFGQRQRFFEGLARAVLAAPQPLLLLIDDVQWCDQETLRWLHFLLRVDPRKRVLLIGTARAEDLMPGHPVAEWLVHLRSDGRLIELTLGPLDPAETAQLAAQVANRELDDESARRLYRETEGNPLFVVEMARAGLDPHKRERGTERSDISVPQSFSADLPPRMHAVIAGRLAHLSPGAHEVAGLAASVGRVFTIEILRVASALDEASLTNALDELWQRRIVRAVQGQAASAFDDPSNGGVSGPGVTSFDFSHDKIRDVAYVELSPIKQRHWHSRVARALELVYAGNLHEISAELAAHYDQAGEALYAIPYYQRAANIAQGMYAYEESTAFLNRGLALLHEVRDQPRGDELRLNLLRSLSLALVATRGYGAHDVLETLSQGRTLNQLLGKPPDPLLLRAAAIASVNVLDLQQALRHGDQLLQLADQQDNSILLVEGHYVLGVTLSWAGSFTRSRVHLEQALTHYDPANSSAHLARYSQDPSVVCQCRVAFDLWCLGYPDLAESAQDEGLARAQALAHPFSLAYALIWRAMLDVARGDSEAVLQSTQAVLTLSEEHHFELWAAWATVLRGWGLAEGGDPEAGIAELERGDEIMCASGAVFLRPFVSALRVQQLAKMGQVGDGLELLDEALVSTEAKPYWCDAELHRLRGLLLADLDPGQAETAYRRAILVARKQQARMFELRAATNLARLWLGQHRGAEARNVLEDACGWFTEGRPTPDLRAARAVLRDVGEEHRG